VRRDCCAECWGTKRVGLFNCQLCGGTGRGTKQRDDAARPSRRRDRVAAELARRLGESAGASAVFDGRGEGR